MPYKPTNPSRGGAFAQRVAKTILNALGWRIQGSVPVVPKMIVTGAPHTTNWDLFYSLLAAAALRLPMAFAIKDSVFFWPLGPLVRRLGGIPINRRERSNTVEQLAAYFRAADRMTLVVAPEGTRKGSDHFKLGFYWTAQAAGVPIVPAFINYERKVVGLGEPHYVTGDLHEDFGRFQAFYAREAGFTPQLPPSKRPLPDKTEAGAEAHVEHAPLDGDNVVMTEAD